MKYLLSLCCWKWGNREAEALSFQIHCCCWGCSNTYRYYLKGGEIDTSFCSFSVNSFVPWENFIVWFLLSGFHLGLELLLSFFSLSYAEWGMGSSCVKTTMIQSAKLYFEPHRQDGRLRSTDYAVWKVGRGSQEEVQMSALVSEAIFRVWVFFDWFCDPLVLSSSWTTLRWKGSSAALPVRQPLLNIIHRVSSLWPGASLLVLFVPV